MPPNRKSHVNFADTVDILQGSAVVRSKFVPLSADASAVRAQAQPSHQHPVQSTNVKQDVPEVDDGTVHASHALNVADPANEYWNWPSASQSPQAERDRLLRDILEKDHICRILSTKRVEEHLLRTRFVPCSDSLVVDSVNSVCDGNKTEDGTVVQSASQSSSNMPDATESDAYWAWSSLPSIDGIATSDPNAQDYRNSHYWYMPPTAPKSVSDKNCDVINRILEQERCRKLLSTDRIVDRLKASARQRAGAETDSETKAVDGQDSDRYWSW